MSAVYKTYRRGASKNAKYCYLEAVFEAFWSAFWSDKDLLSINHLTIIDSSTRVMSSRC